MFTINIDNQDRLIEVALSGMLSTAEVVIYVSELKRQITLNRLRHYTMMIDISCCPIQSQDVLLAMGQHMATMPKAQAIAIVTGSSLARMQARRLFTQPYARITTTVEQGRAWVLDHVEPVA